MRSVALLLLVLLATVENISMANSNRSSGNQLKSIDSTKGRMKTTTTEASTTSSYQIYDGYDYDNSKKGRLKSSILLLDLNLECESITFFKLNL